jgi:hypothetical protein
MDGYVLPLQLENILEEVVKEISDDNNEGLDIDDYSSSAENISDHEGSE